MGALAVDNRAGGKRFGADERTLLDGVATQATIAIDNARTVDALRRSREQVLRADRLGTLGTMAAGLAHEINNPLVSIHTFLSLAPQKRFTDEDDDFWGDYHQLACREVDRIRGLVSTMSNLSRDDRGHGDRAPVDLAHLAHEVARLLSPEAQNADVTLEVDTAQELPKVFAVRDHLHQVFLNLVLNAIHATPAGGRVRIACAPDPLTPEECVSVQVQDTGEGIAEENLDRIFDPFFTTKDPDQGTGLGLMIAHQVLADHGGSIDVRSREGEGATFTLRVPVNPPGVG
jgi:signal transduction histidine kinase